MKEIFKSKGLLVVCVVLLGIVWIGSEIKVRENKKDLNRWHETSQIMNLSK